MSWTKTKRKILKKIDTEPAVTKHGITYEVFKEIPSIAEIKLKDLGARIWLCSEPRTSKTFLEEIHDEYYVIRVTGTLHTRAVFKNEAMIHPKVWSESRYENLNSKISKKK